MNPRRQFQLVRNFPEHGMKLMLENAANVRDVVRIVDSQPLRGAKLSHMKRVPTTFIQRDYRRVESDVLWRAFTRLDGEDAEFLIYMLIEHQSKPDRLMPLRVLEYQVEAFRLQVREWLREHESLKGFVLAPVLPIVFYTGTETWSDVGTLRNIMSHGDEFEGVTARLKPLFLNLPGTPADELSRGEFFGALLKAVQVRHESHAGFSKVVEETLDVLATMPPRERNRYVELLSYLEALIYHERGKSEQAGLVRRIRESVKDNTLRNEVSAMAQTMAEYLQEKGREEGELRRQRHDLLRLLGKRFGPLPKTVSRLVESTHDSRKLDAWFDAAITATSLDELHLSPK